MPPGPPRVRFAPAPTGYLHLGGARTALFNWIFARQQGGQLLLRVEDTDADRTRPELIEVIYDVLRWLGIDWDGEVVHQSDRLDLYGEAVEQLLASGHAYRCDCTAEQVQERAKARGGPPGYDGHCRERGVGPGAGVAIRFRTPDEGTTSFDDVVRGHVAFENANLEDFVLVRSSGVPTFFVANAVDDADMGITHVIRGEDLVNVTPKVLLIREALGVNERPVFAHLPLIVNEQRKKLSKRRDDVSVADYRARGYLPEAMANYLALLGWGPPDGVEIRPMSEIVELFRLEDITKSSAFFDHKKLDHFNGEWIRRLAPDEFVARSKPFVEREPWGAGAVERLGALAPLVQERVKRLDEVPDYVDFLFVDSVTVDPETWGKALSALGESGAALLDDVVAAFETCEWHHETLYECLRSLGEQHGVKQMKKTSAPVRLATTGRTVGPPLFEALELLGRERTVGRLRAAIAGG